MEKEKKFEPNITKTLFVDYEQINQMIDSEANPFQESSRIHSEQV